MEMSPKDVAKKRWDMDENTKSSSFLQKPPETLAYAIYIQR
jgi:hypothetical protein